MIRISKVLYTIAWFIAVICLSGISVSSAASGKLPGQITISGRTLLRDGKPWVPKTVAIVGTSVPPAIAGQACVMSALKTALANLSESTFTSLKTLGADTARITVSATGYDPASTEYDPGYAAFTRRWVNYARSIGLNVVLTMRQHAPACVGKETMPDNSTAVAWKTLAPLFAQDHGVIFELFSEPNSQVNRGGRAEFANPTAEDWAAWQRSFNNLISIVRATGASNPLGIQGLMAGKEFNSAYPLTDPDNSYIWTIHVYFNAVIPFKTPADWDQYFGNFCRSSGRPCLITEWQDAGHDINPRTNRTRSAGCSGDAPAMARQFISYVMANKWGLGAWAFDYPNTVMVGTSKTQVTTYDNWRGTCGNSPPVWGNGQLLFKAYNDPAWGR